MRVPKVGEIWQSDFAHKKGEDTFEYIKKVSDDYIWMVPVGATSAQKTLRVLRSDFIEGFFYVQ